MPPKAKLSRQDIIDTAVDIVRKHGVQQLNARTIAAVRNCSTQPIFSNFATMDELRLAVIAQAEVIHEMYIAREMASNRFPSYKASGMAYIRFAKEEQELFKLLYMRHRGGEKTPEGHRLTNQMESIVHANTGLVGNQVKLFHLEMWAYVHGIATMFATGFLDLDWDLVSKMLTDVYQGLSKQYGKEQ